MSEDFLPSSPGYSPTAGKSGGEIPKTLPRCSAALRRDDGIRQEW
jgi:hypothetical protein